MNHKGLIANFGTVDAGYRGELQVSITNVGNSTMKLRHGDRIAQAVLAPVTRANIVEGVVSTDTERGTDGFGSTGR
jgi:dUTP pyrophosphatase